MRIGVVPDIQNDKDIDPALREQISLYGDIVYNWLLRETKNVDVTEDIHQETICQACLYYAKLNDVHKRNMYRWLITVARNEWRDYYRREMRQRMSCSNIILAHSDQIRICSPEKEYERKEFLERYYRAVGSLPETYQSIILLIDVEGLSYEDAAKKLEISEGNAGQRLYRARKRVRALLADYPPKLIGATAVVTGSACAPALGTGSTEIKNNL